MRNILNIKDMGVTDNFYELGGHSLNTVMLSSRIYKEFQVEVRLKEIYQHPTARELAKLISLKTEMTSGILFLQRNGLLPAIRFTKKTIYFKQNR